jgi:cellulose synthase (UDP-forming)
MGNDIFGSNPKLFYDVILRRRNFHNASFCCGAASIHRRDFLFECAEIKYQEDINHYISEQRVLQRNRTDKELRAEAESKLHKTVFEHHISEDIYTSLLIHSAPGRNWKSVQHIYVESKMLSPQDLESRVKQYARYAQGSIDIALGKHSPLVLKGLSLRQRLCYINTVYTYFSTLWISVFLLSPIVFFFTLTPPVLAFNFDFFKHFIPFQVLNIILMAIANWGVNTHRAKQYYISNFWLYMQSIFKVLRQRNMEFNVTRKKRVTSDKQAVRHIVPHLLIVLLTLLGIMYNTALIIKGIHPSYSGFTVNVIWGLINIYQLNAFIRAAFWKSTHPTFRPTGQTETIHNILSPAL